MVQIIDRPESASSMFARQIGGGLQRGMDFATQMAMQSQMEKAKGDRRLQLIREIEGEPEGTPSGFVNGVMGKGQSDKEAMSPSLSPTDLEQGTPSISGRPPMEKGTDVDPFRKAKRYAAAGEHELARTAMEEAKLQEKQKMADREILNIPAKKYVENAANYRQKSRNIDLALNAELDAILSGEVDPFSSGHIAQLMKDFGLPESLSSPLETVGSKEFKTGQKTFLTNTFQDAFRGATTTGQIALASSLLAEMGGTKEANLASLWLLKAQHDIENERIKLMDEEIEKGVPLSKITRVVEKRLDKFSKEINDEYFDALKELRGRVE